MIDGAATRPRERRRFEQRDARSGRQRRDAPGDQRAKVVRHRERRRAICFTVGEQSRNLECVERVAARRFGEPDEHRPRQCHAEAVDDDPLQRGDGERTDGQPADAGVVDREDEPGPSRVGAQRDDDAKRCEREPAECELERRGARRIEPLRVVHGEQDGAAARQFTQDREQGGADEAAARRAAGIRAQERDVDCTALWRRQQREDLVSDRLEQVGQGGEGEPRLRLRGPSGHDTQPARLAAPHRLLPHRRLADARLSDDLQRGERRLGLAEKLLDDGQLRPAPNEDGHGRSVRRPASLLRRGRAASRDSLKESRSRRRIDAAMSTTMTFEEREVVEEATDRWWLFLLSGIAWLVFALIVFQWNYTTVYAISYLFGIVALVAGGNEFIAIAVSTTGWKFAHGILGALFVIAGIWALVHPHNAFATIAALIGLFILFKGIFDLTVAFVTKNEFELWWLQLVIGILEIVLAFWVAGSFRKSAILLVAYVGIVALTRGITEILLAFKLKGARKRLTAA